VTVIDRDDIMLFFDRDANFNHKFQQLIERHNLDVWGRTPERAEAMLADFRNWIYLQLLTMDTYEVDVSETSL
jgi:hypothetical protein